MKPQALALACLQCGLVNVQYARLHLQDGSEHDALIDLQSRRVLITHRTVSIGNSIFIAFPSQYCRYSRYFN